MLDELAKAGHLFIFEKDSSGRYLACNESFARVAGVDSPADIVGRRDSDLYWGEQADFFRRGDRFVMRGGQMLNTPEIQLQPDKPAQIVTTKLCRSDGNGVLGSYIDLSGYMLVKKNGKYDTPSNRFYLGEALGNDYLDRREFQVFKLILLGFTTGQISQKLVLSQGTVCWYTDSIKRKLQCARRQQLLHAAIRYGLTHVLY